MYRVNDALPDTVVFEYEVHILISASRKIDENGTVLVFNSRVDALNWLSDHGWEFCSSTTSVSGSGSNGDSSVSSSETWILKYCVEGLSEEEITGVYSKFNLREL